MSTGTFRIAWVNYPGNPPAQVWPRERFTDDAGFDEYDQQAIDALAIGQSVTLGDGDCVTVTRLKGETVIVQEWLAAMDDEGRRALTERAWAATQLAGRGA